jgi:uncharacterized protein
MNGGTRGTGARGASAEVVIDCKRGHELGCETFCCRLIVRLGPSDPPEYDPAGRRKSCVDKDLATGLCVHLDVQTRRCSIWPRHPTVCRGYDCNEDPLLRVVLLEGFTSLTRLVTASPPPRAGSLARIRQIDVGPRPRTGCREQDQLRPQSSSDSIATTSEKARPYSSTAVPSTEPADSARFDPDS